MSKPDAVIDELIGYWHHALKTPQGLRLETPDRSYLINYLYKARQLCDDEDLEALAIVKDALHDNVLWIVYKAHAQNASGGTAHQDLG